MGEQTNCISPYCVDGRIRMYGSGRTWTEECPYCENKEDKEYVQEVPAEVLSGAEADC
jgi:hypothetical protein